MPVNSRPSLLVKTSEKCPDHIRQQFTEPVFCSLRAGFLRFSEPSCILRESSVFLVSHFTPSVTPCLCSSQRAVMLYFSTLFGFSDDKDLLGTVAELKHAHRKLNEQNSSLLRTVAQCEDVNLQLTLEITELRAKLAR